LRRKRRRLLKKRHSRVSPSKGKPSVEPRPDSIAEAVQDAQDIPVRNNRLGRPATIETNHVFCPNESCRGFQVIGPNLNHWIVGHGTYTTQGGEKRQMFLCKLCNTPFSETRGTVFFGLKTPSETVYRALTCLAEGLGIRATARVFQIKKDTVLRWLRRAGQHSAQVSAYLMRNFQVEHAQLDELWTFVFKKEKTLSAWEKLHTEYGDNWIWTAIDPVHKLVLAFVLGDHEEHQAVGLLKKLKAVLAKDCMPLFTSDQLPHYISAILKVFGRLAYPKRKGACGRFPNPRFEPSADLQYATVHKERQGGRIISVSTRVVFGSTKAILARLKSLGIKTINTSFVERMNLTMRHIVSRLRRKTLCFSKKREYLEWHLHLSIAYYHFVRTHLGLRRPLPEPIPTNGNGSPKKWEYRTPAMSASLTDHIWTMKELLTFRVPEVPVAPI
jgi:IS1 family transposase/transposase-like protein